MHRKSAHLTKLQKIVTVQDDERREVAHEIERTIGQSLIASTRLAVGSQESVPAKRLLDHLDAIITRTRSMASTLILFHRRTDLIVARRIREELGNPWAANRD